MFVEFEIELVSLNSEPFGWFHCFTRDHSHALPAARDRKRTACKMIHSGRADVAEESGLHGSLGPCAPQAPGSDEDSAGVEAWKHAWPGAASTLSPVDIGSPAESCDSRMTDASVLSSIGTLVAAASSDGGEDTWDWLGDSGDKYCATQRPDTVDCAVAKGQPIQRTLASGNLKRASVNASVTKAIAKRAQMAPGIPRTVQTYLPLGMMAAALKRDLDERKLLAQQKNRTKAKKTVCSTYPITVPDGTVMGTPWA